MIDVAPATINCDEYGSINVTASITPKDSGDTVEVISVELTQKADGFTLTSSGNTFTIAGAIEDVFPRTINFKDDNNQPKTVHHFRDLPPSYMAVYQYIPPSESSREIPIKITYSYTAAPAGGSGGDGGGPSLPQTIVDTTSAKLKVNCNHPIANAAFSKAVKKGTR